MQFPSVGLEEGFHRPFWGGGDEDNRCDIASGHYSAGGYWKKAGRIQEAVQVLTAATETLISIAPKILWRRVGGTATQSAAETAAYPVGLLMPYGI